MFIIEFFRWDKIHEIFLFSFQRHDSVKITDFSSNYFQRNTQRLFSSSNKQRRAYTNTCSNWVNLPGAVFYELISNVHIQCKQTNFLKNCYIWRLNDCEMSILYHLGNTHRTHHRYHTENYLTLRR